MSLPTGDGSGLSTGESSATAVMSSRTRGSRRETGWIERYSARRLVDEWQAEFDGRLKADHVPDFYLGYYVPDSRHRIERRQEDDASIAKSTRTLTEVNHGSVKLAFLKRFYLSARHFSAIRFAFHPIQGYVFCTELSRARLRPSRFPEQPSSMRSGLSSMYKRSSLPKPSRT